MRVCRNAKFRHTLLNCVRVSKMQGAEIEDDGSVLKYMTKSEIEEQRSSLLIMTQRHVIYRRVLLLLHHLLLTINNVHTGLCNVRESATC